MKCIFAIAVILAIFSLPQVSNGQLNWTMTFEEGDLLFDQRLEQDSNTYAVIIPNDDRASLSIDVGYPELPVCVLHFALPEGTQPHSVSLISVHKRVIDTLDYLLHPVQTPIDTMQYPFVPPNSAYEDSIYPVDESLVVTSTNVYMARGVGIATVVVTPMQYSPSTGELFLCEYISFTINYAGMDGPPQQYSFRSARVGRALSDYIKLMVDNDPDVDNIIPIIPEPPPRPPDGVFPDYMIITDANMAASFEPLRIWKTKKGIPTRTVILETDIYAYF